MQVGGDGQVDDRCNGSYIQDNVFGGNVKWTMTTLQHSAASLAYLRVHAEMNPAWEQEQRSVHGHVWHTATMPLLPARFIPPKNISTPHTEVQQPDGRCIVSSIMLPLYGGYAEFFAHTIQVPSGAYLEVWGRMQASINADAAKYSFNSHGWSRSVVKLWSKA